MDEAEKQPSKFSIFDFIIVAIPAIIIDLLGIIPGVSYILSPLGLIGQLIYYWLRGIIDWVNLLVLLASVFIEFVPVASEIYFSNITYAAVTFLRIRGAEKAAESGVGGELAAKLASRGNSSVSRSSTSSGAAGTRQAVATRSGTATNTASKAKAPGGQSTEFGATDQYGQTMGPQTAGGEASSSPYAQPGQEEESGRPQGRKPSHPVLRARSGGDHQEQEAEEGSEVGGKVIRDPRFDQYGNRGPVPEGSPTISDDQLAAMRKLRNTKKKQEQQQQRKAA